MKILKKIIIILIIIVSVVIIMINDINDRNQYYSIVTPDEELKTFLNKTMKKRKSL